MSDYGMEEFYLPLPHGLRFTVSECDLDRVLKYQWHLSNGYVTTTLKNGKNLRLNRMLLCLNDPDLIGDHKDGCKLNNTRSNLRRTGFAGNARNARKHSTPCSSKYKGVHFLRKLVTNQWGAGIRHEGKYLFLGCFADEVSAALAYNEAATRLFGEYARLNGVTGTIKQNGKRKDSKFVGVCFNRTANKWQATVAPAGRSVHLGLFKTEKKAAQTRDAYIRFHRLNLKLNTYGKKIS
jgi:hypothetical protein